MYVCGMARPKKKPEELTDDIMGNNPLMNDVLLPVRRKTKKIINKTGEIDYENTLTEITPYTKLFEVPGGKAKMASLSVRGKEMLLYLMHYLPSARDYIWINRSEYMKANNIKSPHTYREAVLELSDHRYIYPHHDIKDVFWINPLYFFKGSRINKYHDQLTVKKTQ